MTRRADGLTLLEVLIAVAIIGAAFAVLALTQVQTLRVTDDSRASSDATDYANDRLEQEVRRILDTATFEATRDGETQVTTLNGGRYQGTLTIRSLGSSYLDAGLLEVEITMSEPARVTFHRWVSCLDVVDPPSVASPDPCPDPS